MPSQDVFPRRNLPPGAEQWGREVEKRVSGAERALEVANQSISGQNRSTASSLSTLSDQLVELSQRKTYTNESYDSFQVNLGDATPVISETFAPITFTLDSRRVVKVEFSVYHRNYLIYDGVGPAVLPAYDVRLHFVWQGAVAGFYSPLTEQIPAVEGQASFIATGKRVSAWDVLNLEPGTYTVGYATEVLSLGGKSGFVDFQNPRLLVDVVGPW